MPSRENLKPLLKALHPDDSETIAKKKLIDSRINIFMRNLRISLRGGEPYPQIPNLRGEGDENTKTIENHPFLIPYYNLLKSMTRAYGGGLYIIDPKGIYVPIEEGYFGVCHLIRVPRRKQNVYALTDFRNCAYYQNDIKNPTTTVIFQGVRETLSEGFKFMADIFFVTPVSAVSPEVELEFTYEIVEDKEMIKPEEIGQIETGFTDYDEEDTDSGEDNRK